jgi:hypothetical protein
MCHYLLGPMLRFDLVSTTGCMNGIVVGAT